MLFIFCRFDLKNNFVNAHVMPACRSTRIPKLHRHASLLLLRLLDLQHREQLCAQIFAANSQYCLMAMRLVCTRGADARNTHEQKLRCETLPKRYPGFRVALFGKSGNDTPYGAGENARPFPALYRAPLLGPSPNYVFGVKRNPFAKVYPEEIFPAIELPSTKAE